MADDAPDSRSVERIRLAIERLRCLSTLPCVAAKALYQLQQPPDPAGLGDIVESDPALACMFIPLASRRQQLPETGLARSVAALPPDDILTAVLSVEVCFERANGDEYTTARKNLMLHSLATGCLARDMAAMSQKLDPELAYLAGLLHDLGKLAMQQLMPRSFACVTKLAEDDKVSTLSVEQELLGIDHATAGRRLAEKWGLPAPITAAVWLHHGGGALTQQASPYAQLVQTIRAADTAARQCGIGCPGSFQLQSFEEPLGLTRAQIDRIMDDLPAGIEEKVRILGLETAGHPGAGEAYCTILRNTAADLIRDRVQQTPRLESAAAGARFVSELLGSIKISSPAADLAEEFAAGFQKLYRTGPVCVYVPEPGDAAAVTAVVVEGPRRRIASRVRAPGEMPAIPKSIRVEWAVFEAANHCKWLLDQLDVDFDVSSAKVAPLMARGNAVAAIVFELRGPLTSLELHEGWRAVLSAGGFVLDAALCLNEQKELAERLVRTETAFQGEDRTGSRMQILAEMAAGAAHELNNPLAVISGRAQVLAASETDPHKLEMLQRITSNAGEIAGIIESLMTFADPAKPRPAATEPAQVIDEAISLAAMKTGVESPGVQVDTSAASTSIFADSAQIASALGNIIANAIESYTDASGEVRIQAADDDGGRAVRIVVSDSGRGMDRETLHKATAPFFSSRPAGRGRGIGLPIAERLIRLNSGFLRIQSRPGSGTNVTVTLPAVQR